MMTHTYRAEVFDHDDDEELDTLLGPGKFAPHRRSSLSVEASLLRTAIHLNYIVIPGTSNGPGCVAQVGAIIDHLQFLKVTMPCGHNVSRPLPVRALASRRNWFMDSSGSLWTIRSDFNAPSDRDNLPEGDGTVVYYVPTDRDPVAQWLSICNSGRLSEQPRDYLYILRRDCCLACTIEQAQSWPNVRFVGNRRRYVVISFGDSGGDGGPIDKLVSSMSATV